MDAALGRPVEVAPFGEVPGCRHELPVEKVLVSVADKLLLYEPFGSKADRTDCQSPVPGGAWIVDPETGKLTAQIGSEFHFYQLIPGLSGSTLFGIDPGNAEWNQPVQLVTLNVAREKVVASRTFEPGVMQIAVAVLRGVPAGDLQIAAPGGR